MFGRDLRVSLKEFEIKSRLGLLVIFLFAEGSGIGNVLGKSVYEEEIHIPPGIIEMSVWGDDICNFHRE